MATREREITIKLVARDMTEAVLNDVKRSLQSINEPVRETPSLARRAFDALNSFGHILGIYEAVRVVHALETGIKNVAVEAIKSGAEFEMAVVDMGLAARGSGAALQDLHDAAIAVGNDTHLMSVDAAGAADAITALYKAGLSTGEIFGDLNGYLEGTTELSGALRAAIDLAAATNLDLGQAADVATVALSTFGGELETEEERAQFVNEAIQSLVRAANASAADVPDMVDAWRNVGATASMLNVPIEDVNTALAVLSQRGIKGAQAGTALRRVLLSVLTPTKQAQDALDELGVSLYDSTGNALPLEQVIGELSDALYGERTITQEVSALTDEQNALLEAAQKRYEYLNERIREHNAGVRTMSDTALAKANAEMQNSLAIIEELSAKKGEVITVTRELTEEERNEYMRRIAGVYGINALSAVLKGGAEDWQEMAAAIGNAATLEEMTQAKTETLTGKWEILQDTIATLKLEIVEQFLPALSGAVDSLTQFISEHRDDILDFFTSLRDLISDGRDRFLEFKSAVQNISLDNIVSGLRGLAENTNITIPLIDPHSASGLAEVVGEQSVNLWNDILAPMGEAVKGVFDNIKQAIEDSAPTFEAIKGVFQDVFDVIGNVVQGDIIPNLIEAWDGLIEALNGVGLSSGRMRILFTTTMEVIAGVVVGAIGIVIGFLNGAAAAAGTLIDGFNRMRDGVEQVFDGIARYIAGIMLIIKGIFDGNGEEIKAGWQAIMDGIKDIVGGALEGAVGSFETIFGTILSFAEGFVEGMIDFFKGLYDKLIGHSIIPDMLNDIRDFINGFSLIDAGKNLIGGLIDGIKQMAAGAMEAAANVAEGVVNTVKDKLGIHSPSQVFMDIGGNIASAFAQGITSNMEAPVGATTALLGGVVGAASAPPAVSSQQNITVNVNVSGGTDTDWDEVAMRVSEIIGRRLRSYA